MHQFYLFFGLKYFMLKAQMKKNLRYIIIIMNKNIKLSYEQTLNINIFINLS